MTPRLPRFALASPERQRFLLFAAAYMVLWMSTWYAARLFDVLGSVSLWYLPAALRFCSLLLFGWPGLLVELSTALLVNSAHLMMSSQPLPSVFSMQMFWSTVDWYALPLAYAVVLIPLRRFMGDRWDLSRPKHSFMLLTAALVASTLAALVGATIRVSAGTIAPSQWDTVASSWFIGDFIGIITLAPLLIVRVWPRLRLYLREGHWARSENVRAMVKKTDKVADVWVTLIVLVALLLVVAAPRAFFTGQNLSLLALALLIPQIGIALRFSQRGALLAVLLLDSGLVVLVYWLHQGESALQYQLIMVAIALVGLWLGGAVESRNRHMARNRDFARVSNDLLWETDEEGVLLSFEGHLAKHFVMSPGQSLRALRAYMSPHHLELLEQAFARRQPFNHLEIEILSHAGVHRWVSVNGLPVWDSFGGLTGYRGTASDVTRAHRAKTLLDSYNQELVAAVAWQTAQLQRTNNDLLLKEQRLQVLLAGVPVGVLELDATDCCRYMNVNAGKLTGCDPEKAKERSFLEFVHSDDRARVEQAWRDRHQSHVIEWLEFRLSESNLWCSAYWVHLRKADQSLDGTIVVLADATARRQQDEQLWALAHHDALTDLPNRKLFWDRCTQAMSLAKRHDKGVAMLWMDLDGFKDVNDKLGHAAGDALLQQVAHRLNGRIRDSDTVARMGGDEFAVVMPDITDAETAVLVATELAASLCEVFDLPQGLVHISGSVGIALYPKHAVTLDALAQYADMAMYSAKRAGKNQVRLWHKDDHKLLPSGRAEVWTESRY